MKFGGADSALTRKVKEVFDRHRRRANEAELEKRFVGYLSAMGVKYRRQVRCHIGYADVVTADTVFELKDVLNRRSLFHAAGQLKLYGAFIDPFAGRGRAIVCNRSKVGHLHDLVRRAGVSVFVWPEDKGCILGSPPWVK